jgi:serine protease Do
MKLHPLLLMTAAAFLGFGLATWSQADRGTPEAMGTAPVEPAPFVADPPMVVQAGQAVAESMPVASPEVPGSDRAAMVFSGAIADIAERVTPSVVTVHAKRRANSMDFWSPFHEFFGGPRGEEPLQQGMGSGVVVRGDGIVLTNFHVVNGAEEVLVTLLDGSQHNAEVLGTDAKTDIAVLRVDAANLPAVPVGNSEELRIGEMVLAIGNPFGVGQTVTMGIVSATGRSGMQLADYENFIQTDAAINPGNSGGALVNARGQLVGINTAIVSRSGGYQGIGFAIPVRMAMGITEQLLTDGVVRRGKLGVRIQTLDADLAEAFGHPANTRGVLVSDVERDSAADRAGVRSGDVVQSVDGVETADTMELRNAIASHRPGDAVQLHLLRGAKDLKVKVRLDSLEETIEVAEQSTEADQGTESPLLGLHASDLDRAARLEHQLTAKDGGVVVRKVEPGSPASKAGIESGDIIVEVNRQAIKDAGHFRQLAEEAGNKVALLVLHQGQRFWVVLANN